MSKTFTPEDLLAHSRDMMDRITSTAREKVAAWRPADTPLEQMLAELEELRRDANSHHLFILCLFACNGLLLDAKGAIPLDPRTEQLDRDIDELILAVVDAYRNPAPAALQ